MAEHERGLKLLQGYIWHPRELEIDLGDYLPRRIEGEVHVLWDPLPQAPFTFFDDGTLAATQQVYQFTVLKLVDDPEEDAAHNAGIVPWLAELLQGKLERTPAGVGWQIFEDLRGVG
ncbi:MAG TPA: DUF3208 family protein [Trueperaceae bacterium]